MNVHNDVLKISASIVQGAEARVLRSRSVSHQKGRTISYFTFSHTSVVMLILPSRTLGAGCVV